MNMGGPAHHVSLLSGLLDPSTYETLLVSGNVGPGEASLTDLAEQHGARLQRIPSLGPQVRPWADLRALIALARIIRRFRPDIVHTHTSKAGMLGRTAVLLAARPKPLVVHTFHGHVLEGYFGRFRAAAYRSIERALARRTDCLIGVSQATVDDLVRLAIAPRERFRLVPLGLALDRFLLAGEQERAAFRHEVSASEEQVLLVYVGRLVRIKRIDVMLRAFAKARAQGAPIRLVLVGDGGLRGSLEALAHELGVQDDVRFLGYRTDLERIAAGADVALLTSEQEGTPVFLIEAAASSRPAVATAVGGVREVVVDGTGLVVPAGDEHALSEAILALAADADLRQAMGARAREHVRVRFSSVRLIKDVDALYREQLMRRNALGGA